MWRIFQRILLLVGIALVTGIFFQFSIEKGPLNEYEFIIKPTPPPFTEDTSAWTDSVFHTLDLNERIGQLMMIPVYPEHGKADMQLVSELIRKYKVGGLIFFRGTPEKTQELIQHYQSLSETPLLIAIDGEWGPSMRLSETLRYPRQMMLGAIDDEELLFNMGSDIGKQLNLLGIHVNFAPVVDVNSNPANPVIGSRSFGEEKENVARKGIQYMKGMQSRGILAVAKHFPGHGDTDQDSHLELPRINHSRQRLENVELYPFKALINNGVAGIMTAHLNVPALDPGDSIPSSLSRHIIDSLLVQELNFKGLIFTDAMNMQGASGYRSALEANLMALRAGNDILLMPADIEKTINEFGLLAENDTGFRHLIDHKCRKILEAKSWAVIPNMDTKQPSGASLKDSLNSPFFELNRRKLIEASLTVVSNPLNLIPIRDLDQFRIAAVAVGSAPSGSFQDYVQRYTEARPYVINDKTSRSELEEITKELKAYNLILLSLHSDDFRAYRQFGFNDDLLRAVDNILLSNNCILTAFTSPYLLTELEQLDHSKAFVMAYENDPVTQSLTAQMLFGAVPASGRLPVTISPEYPAGRGLYIKSLDRLKYTIPLDAGLDGSRFYKIDSMVQDGISKKAMPGCQILIARNGMIVYQKSYGYHTYHKIRKVTDDDLYDLASLTKIVATVPSLMYLENLKKIDLNKTLGDYLPELDTFDIAKLKISDVLLHQAGLKPYIPFYQDFLEPIYPNQEFSKSTYSKAYPFRIAKKQYVNKHLKYQEQSFSREPGDSFSVKVADGLYMNPALRDSIFQKIAESEIGKSGVYVYSDLGFYLFREIIERQAGTQLEDFVRNRFYDKLGAAKLRYNPLERYSAEQITPTENDLVFRRQVVHGYVHDPGAAMLGGVSGHAGLFSNANDLAKYAQMLLNKGLYGGHRYLDKKLLEKYISGPAKKNGNRRGLGFDKPETEAGKISPACKSASPQSFGHTGFTGTMMWMDPASGILFIFLSNRVYPDAVTNMLSEMNIRTRIQEVIYQAVRDE